MGICVVVSDRVGRRSLFTCSLVSVREWLRGSGDTSGKLLGACVGA
jgi:hypothetical protein